MAIDQVEGQKENAGIGPWKELRKREEKLKDLITNYRDESKTL